MERVFDFMKEHPGWTFLYLLVILGAVEGVARAFAH